MKILLLGEFSGFFKNLKEGFIELGHDVTLIAQGDGWKRIEGADISLDSKLKKPFRAVHIAFNYFKSLKYMKNYDIVLIINPNFFKRGIHNVVLKYLVKHNTNIYLSACGDDVEFINYGLNNNFRFWPFMKWCPEYRKSYYQTNREKKIHQELLKHVKKVIPTATMYKLAWDNSKYKEKVNDIIPLPINTSSIEFKQLILEEDKKIIFFHGLNRECFKGTKYIRKAMENIQKKYPNDVECILKGGMPLSEYLEIMKKTHIVIDQCKAYDYSSMNALYAMAMGKVVMGGSQPEMFQIFNIDKCPVISIEPNINQIEKQMEYIINNKNKLSAWSQESRKFVEKYNDIKVIARQYLEVFGS